MGTVKLVPSGGNVLVQGMYVVGANLLSDFWKNHPQCEAELRALHALLADATAAELNAILSSVADAGGRAVTVDLAGTRVALDVNISAQVVRIAGVVVKEVDQR